MKILKNEIHKIITNKYFIFILTLFIFFFSSLLQLIPIKIYRLNINEISSNAQILLNIFSNTICMFLLIIIYRKTLLNDLDSFKTNHKVIMDEIQNQLQFIDLYGTFYLNVKFKYTLEFRINDYLLK